MTILTLLQIIAIAISIISVLVNYFSASIEKKKDNLAAISSNRVIDVLNQMREDVSDIFTLSSADVLRDIKIAQNIDTRLYPSAPCGLAEADGNFRGIVFPFKDQERDLLKREERLVTLAQDYYAQYDEKNPSLTIDLEKQLKVASQEFFIAYSLYDWAVWESVMEQVSGDNYSAYDFDKPCYNVFVLMEGNTWLQRK